MCVGLGGEGKSKNQGWRIGPLPRSKQKNTGTIFGEGWNVLRRFSSDCFSTQYQRHMQGKWDTHGGQCYK